MKKDTSEILDALEEALISSLLKAKIPGLDTKEKARNTIGRVGARITFGKEVFDAVIKSDP